MCRPAHCSSPYSHGSPEPGARRSRAHRSMGHGRYRCVSFPRRQETGRSPPLPIAQLQWKQRLSEGTTCQGIESFSELCCYNARSCKCIRSIFILFDNDEFGVPSFMTDQPRIVSGVPQGLRYAAPDSVCIAGAWRTPRRRSAAKTASQARESDSFTQGACLLPASCVWIAYETDSREFGSGSIHGGCLWRFRSR